MVKKELTTRQKILLAVNAALEKKAKNIVILNIKNVTSFADYTIICSGTSDRQVQSIASSVEGSMKKAGTLPLGIEGEKGGREGPHTRQSASVVEARRGRRWPSARREPLRSRPGGQSGRSRRAR